MNYNLIKSKRKSISISVTENNRIIVRCPYHMSEASAEEFVKSKKDWIDKIVESNNKVLKANQPILDYNEIYINGIRLPLIISNKNLISTAAVYIKDKGCIRKLFINSFSDDLKAFACDISKELNIKATGFYIKAYKSRWGCCRRDGSIILNYLLAMLPVKLQRYVIIHELCHLIYFNHSKNFWNLVERFEPSYKVLRNELKAFNYLTNLY